MDVLLVDLSSIVHPLYHISASEPDPNWTSTKTVERVRALASGQKFVAICCDSGRSFRKDISPEYKAQRPEQEAPLYHQMDTAIERLRDDGYPIWRAKGFEADDVIATATHRILERHPDANIVIASADKDLLQLVTPHVTVKRLVDGSLIGPAEVQMRVGVSAEQMRDYLALVGDASDNIKGCNGVGPKKAQAILAQYPSLEGLFGNAEALLSVELPKATVASLIEFRNRYPLVKELLTLRTDVPIDVDELFVERTEGDGTFTDISEFEEEPEQAELPVAPVAPTIPPTSVLSPFVAASPTPAPEKPESPEKPDAPVRSPEKPDAPVRSPEKPDSPDTRGRVLEMPPPPAQAPRPAPTAPPVDVPPPPPPVAPPTAAERPRRPAPVREPELVSPTQALVEASAAPPVEWERQLEPRSMAAAKQLAADLFASRLFSAYGNPPAVLAIVMAGRELGMSATASLRGFHIIDGKPTLAADLIRALVIRSGAAEYFRCTERSATRATFATKRKDDHDAPPISLTYTIEEAQQAWKGDERSWNASGWGKNPADMLVARAGSKLARLVYPDIVHGIYSPEEF
jgi:5'-3' exonuclease